MQNTFSTTWQIALKQAVRSVDELLRLVELECSTLEHYPLLDTRFPLRVPYGFVSRMEKGNPNDPLLKQVLPIIDEQRKIKGYTQDPVGDKDANKTPGLLHKYAGRVLLTVTGACAIHCRYCFRQHFPYAQRGVDNQGWTPALHYIKQNSTLSEVILSGGDPLLATDATLAALSGQLAEIPHVKRLRIHTRLPIVLPERITDSLCDWLCQLPLQSIIVIHCNHPQEIDASVSQALLKLHHTPTHLFNQSVLLKGINDDSQTLAALSEVLFQNNVIPYYLHQLDKTTGTAHFEVPESRARQINLELTARLPGYLVPKWVKETAGMLAKERLL